MQKLTELLEKHVQWIAIGIGGLFFLFMVWTYVINAPVTATVGDKPMSPGEVDPWIERNEATKLQDAMNSSKDINVEVKPYTQEFLAKMVWEGDAPQMLAMMFHAQPFDVSDVTPVPVPVPGPVKGGTAVATVFVEHLPVIPAAVMGQTIFGRSTIAPPVAQGQPADAAVQQVAVLDINWVSQFFTISGADIDAAFTAAKIPKANAKTCFLQVELIRQEQSPDGTWDAKSEKVIAPIATVQLDPLPAPGAGPQVEADFLSKVIGKTTEILVPPFYKTEKGDIWTRPGDAAAADAAAPFNPATTTKKLADMTTQEKEQFQQFKREEAKRKEEERKKNFHPAKPANPTRRTGRPSDSPDGAPSNAPRDAARPPSALQDAPPEAAGASMDGPPEGRGGRGIPARVNAPPPNVVVPQGDFDPSTWKLKPIEGWAHDETVQPGHTYHYKVRYKIKNPVYGTFNVAKPQTLAEQLAIASPDSEWGPAQSIPTLVNFFVAANSLAGRTQVSFEVFRWQDGVQKRELFQVQPGDAIGGKDFATGWTVVDVRANARNNNPEIIVVDAEGHTMLKSYSKDQADPLYQQLKQQMAAPAGAGAAGAEAVGAAGAAGGLTPMGH